MSIYSFPSSGRTSPEKLICPPLLIAPVREGLTEETPVVPLAAFIVELVASDDKVTFVPAIIHLRLVPVSSCSAPIAVNPAKLLCTLRGGTYWLICVRSVIHIS